MTRSLAASLLLVSLLTGCSDGPVTPAPAGAVRVYQAAVPFEEATIKVGESLQLSARVLDATGKTIAGQAIRWTSTQPGVAAVDSTGRVIGVQVGTASIIAGSKGVEDTVRVNVAAPVAGAVACSPGEAGIRLSPGQVYTTTADQAVTLCLQGDAAASEYTYVAFNASGTVDARLRLELNSTGLATAFGPPTPALLPAARGSALRPALDAAFHLRLRQRTERTLTPRRLAAMPTAAPSGAAAAVAPVGETMRLNTESQSEDGCSNPQYRTGRVVTMSERAIVVADLANPANGFTTQDYEFFAATFDTLVWKVDTRNFGEPSDLDKNGRAIIFFTSAVNALTPRDSPSYVGGFFYNRDLFPNTGDRACAGSNQAEMFYMMVPDPSGQINGNPRSVNFVKGNTVGVLAHEFQHLINDSRRLYVNKAPVWEESWLNEGLSHIAEELTFYEVAGLGPGQNLDPQKIEAARTGKPVDAFSRYATDNLERLASFLTAPEQKSLMGTDELATRGAAWSFLRYAADRRGGSEQELWKALVNSRTGGLGTLQAGLAGENPREWMRDWATALYADDAGPPAEARYTIPSWNLRAIYPSLSLLTDGQAQRYARYPLQTASLRNGVGPSPNLPGGSSLYLRFAIPGGQPAAQAAIRTTVGGLPAPSLLRISVMRTR